MTILNLGCGTKTSDHPDVLNIDWSIYIRARKSRLFKRIFPLILRGERRKRYDALSDNILALNLKNGLPYPDDSVEVVYHSHLLEHLDRNVAPSFLREVLRVLVPGGIQRIVVPDFERLCRSYVDYIDSCESDQTLAVQHDKYIESILEQSVRREAFGTAQQPRIRRLVENLILGDARRRGETHQWMYDRISLSMSLSKIGYTDISREKFNTSRVENWNEIGLDLDEKGRQYKPDSLYVEAQKPIKNDTQ